MSKFEEYDLYSKNKDFLVSDSVITFTDTNGKLMALKPDVTLSIVKNSDREIKGVENGKNVYYSEPYPVPVLDFTKETDYNDREQYKSEKGYPYVNEYVTDNAKVSKTVVFKDVEHMDFTDLPLISPFLASMLGSGDVDHEETLTTVNGIVLNWFDYYLKNEGTLDIKAQY
jgi:restriction endonuclease S subunit